MNNISQHISYKEATHSNAAVQMGISNVPNSTQIANMKYVAEHVFEPLRRAIGLPIRVNSFFRSQAVNAAVKGSSTSQHMQGEAIDIQKIGSSYSNRVLFEWILNNVEFDQLIWEHGTNEEPAWIHVSLKRTGTNRRKVLQIPSGNVVTRYARAITAAAQRVFTEKKKEQ